MSRAAPLPAATDSLADLIANLGDIPLARIRTRPPPGTATEAAVLSVEPYHLCELVDGVLVEKAMGYAESLLAAFLIEALNAFVRQGNLGLVTGPDGMVRLAAGLVRIPDVAFFSWSRLPSRQRPDAPIPAVVPDLAVEILSPSNTAAEMARKRREYLDAGVRLLWEVDPQTRTVRVYAADADCISLGEHDTLDGGTLLRGFQLRLRELFGELDRKG